MDELQAYSADCRIWGRFDLGDRRLTDLLNGGEEIVLEDVRLASLEDGHMVELAQVSVSRDELYAVVATGRRGDAARRLHTHTTRVEVELGPYLVSGAVHGTPASDPLAAVVRRAPWVPLTDVTLGYRSGTVQVSEEVPTLLVNRALATSFKAVEEATALLPWETQRSASGRGGHAVDLTDLVPDGTRRAAEEAPQGPEPVV